MSFDFTRINVDKFVHGSLDVSYLPGDPIMSAVLNGPVYVGLPIGAPVPKANMMVGPPVPPVLPTLSNILTVPISLWVDGIEVHVGLKLQKGNRIQQGTNIVIGNRITRGTDIVLGRRITQSTDIATGSYILGSIAPTRGINPTIAAALATKKSLPFDMTHPTKPGWRLRHVCLEGPEIGVYTRGRNRGKVIELPDYWRGLVREDSITVQLTPVGHPYVLFIDKIEDNKVYVETNWEISGIDIEYHYVINASRYDDDLVVEYEGESHLDYPGDNSGYSFTYEQNYVENLIKDTVRDEVRKSQ